MDPDLISSGLGALGSLLGGIGAMSAGNAQRKAMQAAAQQRLNESGVQVGMALGQGERTAAKAVTQAAANGGGLGGSALDVIDDLSSQAMFNARSTAYAGVTEANRDIYQGEVDAANGRNALIGSVVGASSSLAAGWARDSYTNRFFSARQKAAGYGQSIPDYGS